MTESNEVEPLDAAPPQEVTPPDMDDATRFVSNQLQLTQVPRELRIDLDNEAEGLEMATNRYAVAVLAGLTSAQRAAAYLESRKSLAAATGKRLSRTTVK